MIERIKVAAESRTQFVDITGAVNDALHRLGASDGVCHVYVPHTTAGIVVNENADPDVARDMLAWLDRVVPQNDTDYRHAEGNSPAHIKSTVVGQSATLPIEEGRLALGTWQGVYLAEFDGPRQRTVVISVIAGA
jgi:secondary thiamine-phosphate synthase enzyme